MVRFLIRRVLLLVVTMLVTSIIIFALTQLLPGDVARQTLGRDATDEAIAQRRAELGLNEPPVMQYVNWLASFLMGDWGTSFIRGRPPVRPLVVEAMSNSLLLALFTLAISIPVSIILGVLAALNEDKWIDSTISVVSLAVVGLPEFVTGLVLINTVALGLGWLPASSIISQTDSVGEIISQLILPAITATFVLLGYIVRMTRAGVLDELKKPYVRTATLKGLPRRVVIFKHVLRNAMLPTITVIAISFGWLIGGLIVIENVFSYPGLGSVMVEAVRSKNIPIIQASVLIIVFFFALANLIADIVYALLNPRIRLN